MFVIVSLIYKYAYTLHVPRLSIVSRKYVYSTVNFDLHIWLVF